MFYRNKNNMLQHLYLNLIYHSIFIDRETCHLAATFQGICGNQVLIAVTETNDVLSTLLRSASQRDESDNLLQLNQV